MKITHFYKTPKDIEYAMVLLKKELPPKVFNKWLNNVKKQSHEWHGRLKKSCSQKASVYEIINQSFHWASTKEGQEFWKKQANENGRGAVHYIFDRFLD